jgi:hypothetical protein
LEELPPWLEGLQPLWLKQIGYSKVQQEPAHRFAGEVHVGIWLPTVVFSPKNYEKVDIWQDFGYVIY